MSTTTEARKQEKEKYFSFVAIIKVPEVKRFVTKNHLKKANVEMGERFKKFFFNNIDEDVEGATITAYSLNRKIRDICMVDYLGRHTEIYLSHLFYLLEKQSKGESGLLLTSGEDNVTLIRGSDGNIWTVVARWSKEYKYWHIEAYFIGYFGNDMIVRTEKDQILSYNS